MTLVAEDHVCERSDRDAGIAGNAVTVPRPLRQTSKHQHTGLAHERQLLRQTGQRHLVECRSLRVDFLIEAGKGLLFAASETERSKGEDPFAVDDVADEP